ncbi:hypothetical protein [Chryseobacterium kwangjuense]|uniref:Uncharacterized protein n=1 Tax=Chryseobacterium kwangjuense TaxID=267125 RepID=A0A135WET2_9FLAO|nr:hypothetical protein [Chryseobacterium kwangjuense]KXH83414.1 hypothetical protein AU378_13540 [Chryseobacterium kwangjuense]
MKNKYLHLLGMTKKELILSIGDEFNFYPDSIWIYLVHTSFLGRKTFLMIRFENESVTGVEIKRTYGKLKKA